MVHCVDYCYTWVGPMTHIVALADYRGKMSCKQQPTYFMKQIHTKPPSVL